MTPLLEAHGVDVRIGDAHILHGCDLVASAGELVAIVGPNGAGKSTLARAVAGMQRTAAGDVRWDGTDVARLRGRRLALMRAFVPQRPRVPDGITVRQAVEIGRSPHIRPFGRPTRRDHEIVEASLARTGALDLVDRSLSTLSGGELQRVTFAVALAQEAPALIADEPTAHLDLGASATLAKLMRALADEGLAVLLVVHDLALAAAIADRVVVVSAGRTVADGPAHEVLGRETLATVWNVNAGLEADEHGHTALRVDWLGEPIPEEAPR
jgi:iron complex transport system ATP-binding protein